MNIFETLLRDEVGATAIEYGLIVAMLALGMFSSMQGLGGQLTSTFTMTSSYMASSSS